MAEYCESELTVDWFGVRTDVINVSDWTHGKDSNHKVGSPQVPSSPDAEFDPYSDLDSDHQKRSDIVHAIIHNHSLNNLKNILSSGWDVNETLRIPGHMQTSWGSTSTLHMFYSQRTALDEAARHSWTQGVRTLLAAGAKCRTLEGSENPLALALSDPHCPPDLIELLLQHGADPNHGQSKFNPLIRAIVNCRHSQSLRTVELLLEYGADPNINSGSLPVQGYPVSADPNVASETLPVEGYPLSAVLQLRQFDVFPALLRMLLKSGVDVNHRGPGMIPLLHRISLHRFLPDLLDLFFLHGGNVNMEDGDRVTAMQHSVRHGGHSNTIRWLIRHGGHTAHIKVSLLKDHFIPTYQADFFPGTPLLLLQAGMRVSHGAQTQLSNMEVAMSGWVQEKRMSRQDMKTAMQAMWGQLEKAEGAGLQNRQGSVRQNSLPENWAQQMVDLQEVSDEDLDVYPEVPVTKYTRQTWEDCLDQIHTVLEFQSQPQSLQWYSRRCVRENLVSLQPSVIKTLLIPAILKRYILCHEI